MTITRLNPMDTATLTDGGAAKSGNLVSVWFSTSLASSWSWTSLGTLPVGMRPSSTVVGPTGATSGSGQTGLIHVTDAGAVEVFQHNGSTGTYAGTLTFPV